MDGSGTPWRRLAQPERQARVASLQAQFPDVDADVRTSIMLQHALALVVQLCVALLVSAPTSC